VIRAHQPGSEPIDIPETIPNPVVVPKPTPVIQQARTPRPLNANCSASRSSQRTRVFSAPIFSQRASTAMARMTNELTSAICGKDA
jgi:hypothetical protein